MSDKQQSPATVDDESRGAGAWVAAIILIGVGVLFLLQNSGISIPGNWWALFLLIPAIAAFGQAWKAYSRGEGQTSVLGSVIAGIVLLVLTAMFMFDLDVDWGVIWPAVLIVIGVAALGRAWQRR